MPLPSLDKTFTVDLNNQVALDSTKTGSSGVDDATLDRKTGLVAVKDALVASGQWSVKSSSGGNGSNFDAGKVADNSDNWTNPDDIMWDTAGNDHAWIVLLNTALDIELCLDLTIIANNDGGTLNAITSRPTLNGGGFTGGTINVRPTATDEVHHQTTSVSYDWGLGVNLSAGLDFVWNTWVSNDGEVTRVVWLTANAASGLWMIEKPKNPADANDVIVKIRCNGGLTTETTYGSLHDNDDHLQANHRNTLLSAPAKDPVTEFGPGIYITSEGFNDDPCGQQFTIANQVDGDFGFFPAGFASLKAGYKGRVGEAFDLYWGVDTQPMAETYPGSGTKLWIQFGDLIFPWDGSAPITA